ncbi:MAG: hypothetical protein ONB46_10980 [candidate division KSB1 bacterium]|nr:hypothetical protein [candidate division KSB1 bacterium]MDZ7366388.1 hypothetical protein [candidate division KSB1 bacterium]MDZ7404043.1 hypothetical protein [candidate division KSB1 bacterium]
MTKAILLLAAALWLASCSPEQTSLYENIKTTVVAIQALSHDQPGYQPVPDSLRLRFDKFLRALRVVVKTDGCGPQPEAKVEESPGRLLIQFDMKNTCGHVKAEFFDVDILVSPVHENEIRLIVEQRDFRNNSDPGIVLLNQLIDVRKLPGMK